MQSKLEHVGRVFFSDSMRSGIGGYGSKMGLSGTVELLLVARKDTGWGRSREGRAKLGASGQARPP